MLTSAVFLLYLAGLYALSFWSRSRVDSAEDFLVAGRQLSLPLASVTLFGTWFRAATLLTAADEVGRNGLRQIALEPLGSGVCLLLAGFLLARPLSEMKLLTLPDFFRRKFGPREEFLAALVMVPSYFGWIAVQFLALAAILEAVFGLPMNWGVALVALVGASYTYLGGMWSVTLTDALQVVLLIAGLVWLGAVALITLGQGSLAGGLGRLESDLPPPMLAWFGPGELADIADWISLFLIAALGNLAAQDLTQRIFSARTPGIAQKACWLAGTGYLSVGMIPVLLGLAAPLLLPSADGTGVVPALAQALLSPLPGLLFLLAITSAVLSTIDSAILAPASILSENVVRRWFPARSSLATTRWAVVFVAACSLGFAYSGQDAFGLLEDAYALPLVGLVAPLLLGLYYRANASAALAAIVAGTSLWGVHYVFGWDYFLSPVAAEFPLPSALAATAVSFLIYFAVAHRTSQSP